VVGIYVGYDNPKPMGKSATGGQVAAPIFGDFMKMALAQKKPVPFRQPPGIKQVWVNKTTGLRASRGDPDAIAEYFKPGEEPDEPNSFLGFELTGSSDERPPPDADGGFGRFRSADPYDLPPRQRPPSRGRGIW
jgi:penicillin-binding protein 1A